MDTHIGRRMSCPWCHICYPGLQDNLFLPVYHYEVILSWKGSTEIDVLTDALSGKYLKSKLLQSACHLKMQVDFIAGEV